MAGTGSDITLQDAVDLLHKLLTEPTKVQAMLRTAGGVTAAVLGTVVAAPKGTIAVVADRNFGQVTTSIRFDPALSVRRVYGDQRALLTDPEIPGFPHKMSALSFTFPDDSRVSLFELEPLG